MREKRELKNKISLLFMILSVCMMLGILFPVYVSAASCEVYEMDDAREVSEAIADDSEKKVEEKYQANRIIIETSDVSKNYGASEKYIYEEGDMTILVFDGAEARDKALTAISEDYDESQYYVDEVIPADQVFQGTDYCLSWGADTMKMNNIRKDSTIGSKGPITVAVIDSGINRKSAVFNGTTILSDSYNFVGKDNNILDTYGHGTHVAGIIANLTPDNVRLLILKVGNGGSGISMSTLSLALNYAISKNVDVINLSMGTLDYGNQEDFLDKVLEKAHQNGIPVCVAAGNSEGGFGDRNVMNMYPASNPNVFAISAIDQDDTLASYSYYGKNIAFCAPGTNIESAYIDGDAKHKLSGTSMAAPHITAALAYVKMINQNFSVDQCYNILAQYCVDLGSKGWDQYYGYGYPDMEKLFREYCGMKIINGVDSSQNTLAAPRVSLTNKKKSIKITWTAVTNASKYYVYRASLNGYYQLVTTQSNAKRYYVDSNVPDGQFYKYYVVAAGTVKGRNITSAKSNVVKDIMLTYITLNKLVALKNKKVRLTRGGNQYFRYEKLQVQYSRSKTFKKATLKTYTIKTRMQTVKVNKKGNTYFRVRRMIDYGGSKYYSEWSNIKKIKVK